MITLPNGCSCSELAVFPRNWNLKGASLEVDWYISYRFYDPGYRHIPKYKYGKLVIVKAGINRLKTLEERRCIVRELLASEMVLLAEEGYNPIAKVKPLTTGSQDYGQMPVFEALWFAYSKKQLEPHTAEDIRSVLKYVKKALEVAGLDGMPVKEMERKHIKMLLDCCGKVKQTWSNNTFNQYRKYLCLLFNELLQYDAIIHNPVIGISKMKATIKVRKMLSQDERLLINESVKQHQYEFWRFLQIFFHSGSRETELIRLQVKHVELTNQRFLVLIKKGKSFKEVYKPIKNVALPFWNELILGADKEAYVFGEGLKPELRDKPIRTEQITRRWKRHVKGKLGIEADFYSLKHLNTDETAALLGLEAAALQNSHTSTVITLKHYALGEKGRQMERVKKVGNRFA